jgi:mRNA interferase HigB
MSGTVRIISRRSLRDFWVKHPDSEQALKSWYREAVKSYWRSPADIKSEYPSASILGNNRIVFNIKGNHYRLIVRINYDYGMVWIRFIGTHAQYDKTDAKTI